MHKRIPKKSPPQVLTTSRLGNGSLNSMEKRSDKRFTHFTEVVFESASGQREARVSEVSMGGCFVDTIVETPVGENVSFQVIGYDPPLTFTGVVMYTFPGIGFGLKFTELPGPSQEYLKAVLKEAGSSDSN